MPASVLLLLSGLIPSSLTACRFWLWFPFVIYSRVSEDCDKFLAFGAEPSKLSREKLLARRRAVGDLRGECGVPFPFPCPLVRSCRRGDGMSTVNWSVDMEKCRPPAEAEFGEGSRDEFDIASTEESTCWVHGRQMR